MRIILTILLLAFTATFAFANDAATYSKEQQIMSLKTAKAIKCIMMV